MIFVGRVEEGKLILDLPSSFNRYLMTLEGKRVTCEVKKFVKKRTDPQNKFYWAVVVDILSKELGYEKEEIHLMLRERFLRIHDEQHPDFVIAKSTTKLNTQEFNEYIEAIQRWAAQELQIFIPDPQTIE